MLENEDHLTDVTVYDGKYRYVQRSDGGSEALRHGEPWRDCTGDGFILALAQEIVELRRQLAERELADG